MQIDLSGQTALVTGASRGIGKAISRALAAANAYVIGTATSQAGADGIADKLGDKGAGLVYNSARPESLSELVNRLGELQLTPSILVNNAGITRDGLFLRMDDAQWDEVIAVNLSAVMRLTRAMCKGMIKARAGRVINISSVVASLGNAGQVNYAASKAGIEGMSRALARELAGRGITVNAIAPGYIATDMTGKLTEEQTGRLLSAIPLGRMGNPQDIANAVVFLASENGGYITGHTLHLNGGMLMA